MARVIQKELAARLGCEVREIRAAKKAGVDLSKESAVKRWLGKSKRPARKKLAKRKVAPKRPTQEQRAADLGISRDMLQHARRAGVNVWDDEAMEKWKASRRPRVKKSASLKKTEVVVKPMEQLALPGVSIEDLELEVKGAETYDEVKILKEKISALLQAQKVRKEERDLIPMKEAKEGVLRIVSGLKGRLLKVPSDTAPRVEGLAAAKAEKVIRAEMMKALEDLANDGHAIFEGH